MNATLMRYATPFITGLFIISLVSGIALFFHVGQSYFREMHEWLSMVLIIPFVLHLMKNWRPFLNYFRRSPMLIASVISLIAAGIFAYQGMSSTSSGNPLVAVANAIGSSTVAEVAPLFDLSTETLIKSLADKGYTLTDPTLALKDIASASGKSNQQLIGDLVALKK